MIIKKNTGLDANFGCAVDLIYAMLLTTQRQMKMKGRYARRQRGEVYRVSNTIGKGARWLRSKLLTRPWYPLLGSSPHFIVHPWLNVVSVWFCTLWSPNIGVRIIHVGNSRTIGVRVRVDIAIALRR